MSCQPAHVRQSFVFIFFKVEYMETAPANAQRAIGWCYFMTGKYAEAARFFDKLQQADEVLTSDWLNAGHVYLAQNNIPKALECYRQAESHCQSHDEFSTALLSRQGSLAATRHIGR